MVHHGRLRAGTRQLYKSQRKKCVPADSASIAHGWLVLLQGWELIGAGIDETVSGAPLSPNSCLANLTPGRTADCSDRVDLFRRPANYVDRILRGAKAGDLPVQFPTKFEMAVNRKTAKALGLTVPLTCSPSPTR
jgi:hypothetical protein